MPNEVLVFSILVQFRFGHGHVLHFHIQNGAKPILQKPKQKSTLAPLVRCSQGEVQGPRIVLEAPSVAYKLVSCINDYIIFFSMLQMNYNH